MNPLAIRKAQRRLRNARFALSDLAQRESAQDLEDAWARFVQACNIYSALEQGVKGDEASKSWFGKKVAERKSDPLAQYVFQARNDEEHGLRSIVRHVPGSVALSFKGGEYVETTVRIHTDVETGLFALRDVTHAAAPVEVDFKPPTIALQPVRNRGSVYPVPAMHMGQPLHDLAPPRAGELALAWLERVVSEAEGLTPSFR